MQKGVLLKKLVLWKYFTENHLFADDREIRVDELKKIPRLRQLGM